MTHVRIVAGDHAGKTGHVIASECGKWFRVQTGPTSAVWVHRSEMEPA